MEQRTSELRPLIDDRDQTVVAWRCTLTVTDGAASGFDHLELPVHPEHRKPLAQWTRAEVRSLLTWAVESHPLADRLRAIVETRRHLHELSSFSMDQLREGA